MKEISVYFIGRQSIYFLRRECYWSLRHYDAWGIWSKAPLIFKLKSTKGKLSTSRSATSLNRT